MKQSTVAVSIQTVRDASVESRLDFVAVEEPLEIVVNGQPAGITMRTPGDDHDLARGLLYSEGIIDSAQDILSMHWGEQPNTLFIELSEGCRPDLESLRRTTYTSSSCGVCGKLSIEDIKPRVRIALTTDGPIVSAAVFNRLPERLREHQAVFDRTGGLHAAALFSKEGDLFAVREDVGRHNAVDKLIGAALLNEEQVRTQSILFLSGRAGFELAQKAVSAGIPVVAAVGAPSSLAIETARRFGVTLIGFVRGDRFNVYTAGWRVAEALIGKDEESAKQRC